MSSKSIKNIAASVHQRLLNQAKIKNRSFNEWMQYYAMERFLYRLSCSQHASLFILKGAFMLSVWRLSEVRTTMDIDMLGKGSHLAKNIIRQIQDIILTDVVDDGLLFDVDSLQTQSITEDTDSPGIRVTFLGKLNTMRIKMQIDTGFGDVVFPAIIKKLSEEIRASLDKTRSTL